MGQVEIVGDDKAATKVYSQYIESFQRLGREIKISPKANVCINKPGFKTEFFVTTINVVISIGKNHTADLIMSEDAWNALRDGEEVSMTTTEEFKRKYTRKK